MADAAAPKKAPSKPRAKPAHPGFTVMVTEAITALKEVRAPCSWSGHRDVGLGRGKEGSNMLFCMYRVCTAPLEGQGVHGWSSRSRKQPWQHALAWGDTTPGVLRRQQRCVQRLHGLKRCQGTSCVNLEAGLGSSSEYFGRRQKLLWSNRFLCAAVGPGPLRGCQNTSLDMCGPVACLTAGAQASDSAAEA